LGDGVVYLGAQADDPSCCGGENMSSTSATTATQQYCDFLTDASRHRTAVEALANSTAIELYGKCLDVHWEAMIEDLSNVTTGNDND
jgi:hypothetical protein